VSALAVERFAHLRLAGPPRGGGDAGSGVAGVAVGLVLAQRIVAADAAAVDALVIDRDRCGVVAHGAVGELDLRARSRSGIAGARLVALQIVTGDHARRGALAVDADVAGRALVLVGAGCAGVGRVLTPEHRVAGVVGAGVGVVAVGEGAGHTDTILTHVVRRALVLVGAGCAGVGRVLTPEHRVAGVVGAGVGVIAIVEVLAETCPGRILNAHIEQRARVAVIAEPDDGAAIVDTASSWIAAVSRARVAVIAVDLPGRIASGELVAAVDSAGVIIVAVERRIEALPRHRIADVIGARVPILAREGLNVAVARRTGVRRARVTIITQLDADVGEDAVARAGIAGVLGAPVPIRTGLGKCSTPPLLVAPIVGAQVPIVADDRRVDAVACDGVAGVGRAGAVVVALLGALVTPGVTELGDFDRLVCTIARVRIAGVGRAWVGVVARLGLASRTLAAGTVAG